jgi:hypothetical protein
VPPFGRGQFHEANAGHVEEVLQVNAIPIIFPICLILVHWGSIIEIKSGRWLVIADIPKPALALGRCRSLRRAGQGWRDIVPI